MSDRHIKRAAVVLAHILINADDAFYGNVLTVTSIYHRIPTHGAHVPVSRDAHAATAAPAHTTWATRRRTPAAPVLPMLLDAGFGVHAAPWPRVSGDGQSISRPLHAAR